MQILIAWIYTLRNRNLQILTILLVQEEILKFLRLFKNAQEKHKWIININKKRYL